MPEAKLALRLLPVNGTGRLATGWWGMLCLLATEGILFAYLIFSYAYLGAAYPGDWPPGGAPSLRLALPNTLLLLASSVLLELGLRGHESGRRGWAPWALLGTALMGALFMLVQLKEWSNKAFTFTGGAYGACYFTLTGFHLAHVAAGVLALAVLACWSWQGRLDGRGRL